LQQFLQYSRHAPSPAAGSDRPKPPK
jgi:hypothetical protein